MRRTFYTVVAALLALALAFGLYMLPDAGALLHAAAVPEMGEVIRVDDFMLLSIPVGQADCTLVIADGQAMLVDAGHASLPGQTGSAAYIESLLARFGVTRLETIIATHPHEDHIGGFSDIIGDMPVSRAYLSYSKADSYTYRMLMRAIDEHSVELIYPALGDTFALGGATGQFVGPVRNNYGDINDSSLVTRLVYGDCSFLLTGDAETPSESNMLETGLTLRSDVLKLGHHGFYSSSGEDFIKAVHPRYAFVTCDESENGLAPSKTVLRRLKDIGARVYRDDADGPVAFFSDGRAITVKVNYPSKP